MAKQEDTFKVYVKREPGYDLRLTVRFEVHEGHGVIALQGPNREESPQSRVFEEQDIQGSELRGGRFIHVLPGSGRRKSYALSRLTEDVLQRISDDAWTQLDTATEYGFRYMVVPENAMVHAATSNTASAAAVAVAPAKPAGVAVGGASGRLAAARAGGGAAAAAAGGAGGKGPSALARAMSAIRSGSARPVAQASVPAAAVVAAAPAAAPAGGYPPSAAVASLPAASEAVPTGPVPGKPTPVAPALADELLGTLDKDEAIAKLKEEMQKVQDLHDLLADAQRRLAASEARERDLLGVLSAWQQRG